MREPSPSSFEAPVASPCRRLCTLNEADICVGCGRSIGEITEWMTATAVRKHAIVNAAAARLAALERSRG